MTEPALQLHRPDRPPDAASGGGDWSQWISAAEAARRLGKDRDALLRTCRQKLQHQGLAYHGTPPNGGNARWFVFRGWAPGKLNDGPVGVAHQTPDLSQYPRKAVQIAWRRVQAVQRFREAKRTRRGRVADWLDDWIHQMRGELGIKISQRSLYRWNQLYQSPADVEQLVDGRGGDQKSLGDPAAWDHFKELYLDDRQPSLKQCWRYTKAEAKARGWSWCSERSCRRQLDERIPPETQQYHRAPRQWHNQRDYLAQNPERFGANACWVGDHAQLDFWCLFGKSLIRPWLTAWQDWRTRRLVGYTLSASPNSSTILQAFRAAVKDPANPGLPDEVLIDNGKDYDSYVFNGQTKSQRLTKQRLEADEPEFRGLFGMLEVEVHFSLAYNPDSKARLERLFGTIHGFFDKFQSTYCGRSSEAKPESLAETLKHPERIPTFENVVESFRGFASEINKRADHDIADLTTTGDEQGQPVSPDWAMDQWCDRKRVPADPRTLDLFMMHWHQPVQATRNGISIKPLGKTLTYGAHDPALTPYKGTSKKDRPWLHVAYDQNDLSTIEVFDHQLRHITTCELNQYKQRGGQQGLNRRELQRAMKRQREYQKALKTVKDNRELEMLTQAELLAKVNAESENTDPPPPKGDGTDQPAALAPVRTPLDGQAEQIEKGRQKERMRQAAGAEHHGDATSVDDDEDTDQYTSLDDLAELGRQRQAERDDDEGPIDLSEHRPPAHPETADDDDQDTDVMDSPPLRLTEHRDHRDDEDEAGHLLDEL